MDSARGRRKPAKGKRRIKSETLRNVGEKKHARFPIVPTVILLLAQFAVGSAAILARVGLQNGLSALMLAAWRLLIAATIVLLSTAFRKRNQNQERLSGREMGQLITAGLFLGLHFLTWFASLERVSVARSTLLVATSPVWTGLVGMLFLRQRLPLSFWGGLAMAGVGMVGLTLLGTTAAGMNAQPSWTGDVLALVGAMCFSAYLLLVDGPQRRQGTVRTITWTYSVAAVALWLGVIAWGEPTRHTLPQNSGAWLAILGMALVPQLIGHTALNWSLLHFPAGVVGAATLLEPIFAAILAWVMFGEPLTSGQILSAVLLLAGIAVVLLCGRREDATEP